MADRSSLVKWAGATAAILLVPLMSGCLETHQVNPGLLFDDFEEGDLAPNLSQFFKFNCETINGNDPATQTARCTRIDGWQGTTALALDFDLPNPTNDDIGAVTFSPTLLATPLDLRPYTEMFVSASVDPASAQVVAQIHCDLVPLQDPSVRPSTSIDIGMITSTHWSDFRLRLRDFVQQTYQPNRIVGGVEACLKQVTAIGFAVTLKSTGPLTGRLSIDNIRFEDVY